MFPLSLTGQLIIIHKDEELELKTKQIIGKNQTLINTKTFREVYFELNQPEAILEDHQQYNEMVLIGDEDPIGAKWGSWYWYYRNLLVYKHLTKLVESPSDRILVINVWFFPIICFVFNSNSSHPCG